MLIEIFGRDACPYCDKAKKACEAAGIPYTFYHVNKDVTKEEVQTRVTTSGSDHIVKTVPQIFIDDRHIGGYDKLVESFPWAKAYNDSLRK